MTAPTPYLHLPGTARAALTLYGQVFGGDVEVYTLKEFGRSDGPADAVAHGQLTGGPVALYAADAVPDGATGEDPGSADDAAGGITLALLGAAPSPVLRRWFAALAEGGRVLDDLQQRPWGAWDGQVIDGYGVRWLIGFEVDEVDGEDGTVLPAQPR